jgi:hypothetical protein
LSIIEYINGKVIRDGLIFSCVGEGGEIVCPKIEGMEVY